MASKTSTSANTAMQEQAVLVLSSAVRSSPEDALAAILSAESFSSQVSKIGPVGSNALHVATWRNHAGIVRVMLGIPSCDVDVKDEESGWTALHKALYYGHVRIASLLVGQRASLVNREDYDGRTPVDLVSRHLKKAEHSSWYMSHGHVFSWGNGSNYTLGTGSLEVELAPARVDTLHMHDVIHVAAAKFHSAAVTADGRLFTWGWGRGGRLGHPEPYIHDGSSAVIYPRCVASLFEVNKKMVTRVAVAKHHTLIVTADGELFSMGSNKHGQLGYSCDKGTSTSASTQPEPRKVSALRSVFIVRIAAANKHSVAVSSAGDVYTWGNNSSGQLGYGAFDSHSSPLPRVVDALKGSRNIVDCAAAKRHTVVLTEDGDVYTWGHRGVSPRKVLLNGVRKAVSLLDGAPLRFQKGYNDVSKPRIQQICAGAAHTSVLTTSGVCLTWRSADPHCQVQEIGGPLAGESIVSISAGKYRTAAVTDIGTVYMWEGRADFYPADGRIAGSGSKKRYNNNLHGGGGGGGFSVGSVHSVLGSSAGSSSSMECMLGTSPGSFHHKSGSPSMMERMHSRFAAGASPLPSRDTHGVRQNIFEPIVPVRVEGLRKVVHVAVGEKHSLALQQWLRSSDDYFDETKTDDDDDEKTSDISSTRCGPTTLQVQCEETIALYMVDPHTVMQVMHYAEAAGADMLYKRCCCVAALNLDILMTEQPQIFGDMPMTLAQDIENELTSILNAAHKSKRTKVGDDVMLLSPLCENAWRPSRADKELGDLEIRPGDYGKYGMKYIPEDAEKSMEDASSEESRKLRRLILKKMQQIHSLEDKSRKGEKLDFQQSAKIGQKGVVVSALAALDGGVPYEEVNALLRAASHAVVESQQQHGASREHHVASTPAKSSVKPKRKSRKEKNQLEDACIGMKHMALTEEELKPKSIAGLESPFNNQRATNDTEPRQRKTTTTPVKHVGFHAGDRASSSLEPSPSKKPTARKGGLSMFLRGELEDPDSSSQKPVWGAPRVTTPVSPLSKLLKNEKGKPPVPQSKQKTPASGSKPAKKPLGIKVSLKDYLQGKSDSAQAEPSPSPKPWSAGDAPSSSTCPTVKSLRTIQSEQEELRAAQRRIPFSHSPKTYMKVVDPSVSSPHYNSNSMSMLGHSPTSTGFVYGSSPQGRAKAFIASPQPAHSKWYISEELAMAAAKAKPLKDIQEEENALKDIAQMEAMVKEMEDAAIKKKQQQKNKTGGSKKSKSRRKQTDSATKSK